MHTPRKRNNIPQMTSSLHTTINGCMKSLNRQEKCFLHDLYRNTYMERLTQEFYNLTILFIKKKLFATYVFVK